MRVANKWHLHGEEIKNSETYKLVDNTELNNLVVSSTVLYPGKKTRGHSHKDQEEVYMFTNGAGYIWLDGKAMQAQTGDVFTIKAGVHHQVKNTHPEFALHFICIFEGKRNH